MPDPTVSVIIPTFNRAGEMHRSVESVIAQTYRPIQLIVIDDGSSDNTPAVMAGLDERVRAAGIEPTFVRQENGGCARARNTGFEHVKGEYFAFLDDDDEWTPEKLEKQVGELARTGADACCCQARKVITRGEIIQPPTGERLLRGIEPGPYLDGRRDAHLITLVVKTDLLDKVGVFETELKTGSDTEWIARLCHHAEFCAVPEVLAVYVYSDSALSRVDSMEAELKRDARRELALAKIRQKCKDLPNWDEASWRRRAAGVYDESVKHRLYAGDIPGAKEVFRRGMELTAGTDPLPRVRRKIRKARWLALFGKRLVHPKLKRG